MRKRAPPDATRLRQEAAERTIFDVRKRKEVVVESVRWNLSTLVDLDHAVRTFLAAQGGDRQGDLSRFVEEAVRAHLLVIAQTRIGKTAKAL